MRKLQISIISILFFALFPLYGEFNKLGIPDSAEIREGLVEKWFEASLLTVRNNEAETYYNNAGEKFQVRLEETDSSFNIFVSPHKIMEVTVYSEKGFHTVKQDIYPGDIPGSFVLVRDKRTGKALRIRFYFRKNSEVYLQFRPYGKTAVADLVIFGNYAARGVSTGLPFSKFYSISFEDIMRLTKEKLPWSYVLYDVNAYYPVKQMISVISEKSKDFVYLEDAMIDGNGELVHISTGKAYESLYVFPDKLNLSSAGYIKWIGDGLVEPIAGGKLKREPLLSSTVEVKDVGHQGILSQKYNLYFSLDWIRNLSSAIISVYSGTTYLFNQSGVDVTINPFSSTISDNGVENLVTFIQDSGYKGSILKPLLYVLANTDPGTIYFGAIRGTDKTVSPEIKAFNECLVFLPYFTDDGAFQCKVFMNGIDYDLDLLLAKYSDDFIYLTKVKASERFFPD